jgi:hypothetical protein
VIFDSGHYCCIHGCLHALRLRWVSSSPLNINSFWLYGLTSLLKYVHSGGQVRELLQTGDLHNVGKLRIKHQADKILRTKRSYIVIRGCVILRAWRIACLSTSAKKTMDQSSKLKGLPPTPRAFVRSVDVDSMHSYTSLSLTHFIGGGMILEFQGCLSFHLGAYSRLCLLSYSKRLAGLVSVFCFIRSRIAVDLLIIAHSVVFARCACM